MRSLLLALVLISAVSCNRNTAQLEFTNAKGEVPPLGNLVFRFNNALAPDSLLNVWDSTAYIRFKPEIAGKFRWNSPDELVFSPVMPLSPATTFAAELTDEIVSFSKFAGVRSSEKISFHTPGLTLEDINVTWTLQEKNTPAPSVDLYFNYAVDPTELTGKLKVNLEGTAAAFDVTTASESKKISLRLINIKARDQNIRGNIIIEKGLIPKGGTNAITEDINSGYSIPSPFNLVVNDISAQHDGLTGTVVVSTSQQVTNTDIKNLVYFNPAIKFTIETSEEGFVIKSDQFSADNAYRLILKKGIRGNIGGVLHEQYDDQIAFGEIEPSIAFTGSKRAYLSANGNRMLELKISNVPKVKLIVSKIYESNLLAAANYGYEPRESEDRRNDSENEYYSSAITMGDVIYEKEIETASLPKMGNSRLFQFNVEDRLPAFKGIYHVRVRSTQHYWINDSRFISVSDLGLIAKEGADKLFVFANSIKTTAPIQGVNVVAYGNNNQVLGMATTNADGVAEVSYSRKEFAGFKPAMIVAKSNDDFTYLPFNTTKVNTSRFDVGGKKLSSTGLDAFIYGERDIYRPGETINFSVVVRDPSWKIPGQLPVKFRFLYPNGKEARAFRKSLNEQGSVEGQVPLTDAAITGTYTLEVYSSNDVLIGSSLFNVEEFVPDRIKVSASLNKPFLEEGQSATLSINAVNFFGPPASGRNYETEIQLKAKNFIANKYPEFNFGITNKGLSLDKVVRQGKLDEKGNVTETYEVPAMFRNNGILQADFYTTVFDENGRPVSKAVSADVFTQPVFFGVRDDGYWYYALNQPVKFPIVALTRDQKIAANTKASVKVIRREYRTVLAKSGGYFRYESQAEDKVVADQEVNVSGESTAFSFIPRKAGNYELRVSIPGSAAYVGRNFYSYGSWGGDANSFEVNADGNIDIESDKSIYNTGEKAKILFKTPFNGKLLVTVEQDKVLSHQYVNTNNRTATIELPLNGSHLPNIFVTATLVKAHGISDIPLTVAHGFASIRVEEKSRRNKVEIVAAKSSRSNTMQEVSIKAEPNSFVTLAAVDNGVLQVSDFATPDPYKYFYSNRALQVDAYDLYPLLFPELRARLSSTGGDGEMAMQKRVNPMPAKRIRILSYWSGILKTNGNGHAKLRVPIPKFSGQVRLMAVAYRDQSFGSAEAVMNVADPLVISTGLPRFMSPGDSVQVPVTITNTLARNANVVATISATGAIKVIGNNRQSLLVAQNGEGRVAYTIVAGAAADTAKVHVVVESGSEKYTEEISISIRPSAPLQKLNVSGMVAGGAARKVPLPSSDYIAGTAKFSMVLSRSPVLEIGEQLRYLVQYPYGCTEQIISASFPQLYYGELASQFTSNNNRAQHANQNVIETIRKIKMRQLYNGALALWENEGSEHWWTTIYGAHFLIEARKAGFDVDESLINTMLNYINNRLRNKNTIIYTFNRDQKKKIAPKEVAYSLYVLCLASRANVSAMNYYKANTTLLSLDSRYLLSAAFAIAGDRNKFAQLLPEAFSGEISVPQTGGSFYSPLRDEAIALSALLDVDPDNAQVPIMAKHVAAELKSRAWYSTQECAFSFLALGKLAKRAAGGNVVAEVRSKGRTIASFNGSEMRYSSANDMTDVELVTKGSGQMYYFMEKEGVSATGAYKEEDKYLKVRKQFFDRNGRKITGNEYKRNDLVIVQLTLEKVFNTDVENIVVTDMLPAGFEIENPRTKELPGMDWIKDASTTNSIDVRDDRINLFVDLKASRQVYYYGVRAVSPGVYKMGPVAADAMYNGEYHSYHGAGTIKINE